MCVFGIYEQMLEALYVLLISHVINVVSRCVLHSYI